MRVFDLIRFSFLYFTLNMCYFVTLYTRKKNKLMQSTLQLHATLHMYYISHEISLLRIHGNI